MVQTYILNTDFLDDKGVFAEKLGLMDKERKDKILKLPWEKQKLSLGAGLLIKKLVGDVVSYNEYGKPIAPDKEFNVSHSGKYAVISIAEKPVGVDIELLKRGMHRIASRFFSVDECIRIDQSYDPDTTFIKIWTLKEAFLKCLGTGIGKGLNNFKIDMDGDKIRVEQNFNNIQYNFKIYNVEGYRLSVCSEENHFAEKLTDITKKF